jgi:hypothetical protein
MQAWRTRDTSRTLAVSLGGLIARASDARQLMPAGLYRGDAAQAVRLRPRVEAEARRGLREDELVRFTGLALAAAASSFRRRSRSPNTALFIFSTSRRASRSSLATSLRRSPPPVPRLPRIAAISFCVTSRACLIRRMAWLLRSWRARVAAAARPPGAALADTFLPFDGFRAEVFRAEVLRAEVLRAEVFRGAGIDAPCVGCERWFGRASHKCPAA